MAFSISDLDGDVTNIIILSFRRYGSPIDLIKKGVKSAQNGVANFSHFLL